MKMCIGRSAVVGAGLAAALSLQGCIIVADNDSYPGNSQRLSSDELATVPEVPAGGVVPGLRETYSTQFASLAPGMTVEQFRAAFPGAVFAQQRTGDDGIKSESYSLVESKRYRYRGSDRAFTSREEAWFYFKDGRFVKWSRTNEWP